MTTDSPEYDVFLSYASEDREWCEDLAALLRARGGVQVLLDNRETQEEGEESDLIADRLNDCVKRSRKTIAVWSKNYFRDGKFRTLAARYGGLRPDILARHRPLIPVLIDNIEDLDIPPFFSGILYVDFRNKDDFDLRFRELINSLDLPNHAAALLNPTNFPENEKNGSFEFEVVELFGLLGYEAAWGDSIGSGRKNLTLKKSGALARLILDCRENRVAANDRDLILNRHRSILRTSRHQLIVVSAQGFAPEAQSALEEAGITCFAYSELLNKPAPLDKYVKRLISDYEAWREEHWNGEDRFIRPNLLTDVAYKRCAALAHIAEWLDSPNAKQLVILGEPGAGKTALARFLAYDLAQNYIKDPLRNPAPVLIPLKEVRRNADLESIISSHFNHCGFPIADFKHYEYLIRKGKIITIFDGFDAFDEASDQIKWNIARDHYLQLARVAQLNGKFILTCSTRYFKTRVEQIGRIDRAPALFAAETELYKEMKNQTGAAVYLQELEDEQISAYLQKSSPEAAEEYWKKICGIRGLKELSRNPLLLYMLVKSPDGLLERDEINAADLYTAYTNIWIHQQGRLLDGSARLELMMETAWKMWSEEKSDAHLGELIPYAHKAVSNRAIKFRNEDVEHFEREMQTAAFLQRDEQGAFSFAHRSFKDYFIARKIHQIFAEGDGDKLMGVLNTRRFDKNIVSFLTQLDKSDALCPPLQRILTVDYFRCVSENALQILYWSGRIRSGMEEEIGRVEELRSILSKRIPAGLELAGANLCEVTLEAAEITNADLCGADLTKANLNNARLARITLAKAKMNNARIENLSAFGIDFRQADLSGVSFESARVSGCDFTEAKYDENAFADGRLLNNRGTAAKKAPRRGLILPVVQLGHAHRVNAVAYSPDGELIASGGDDGSIHLCRVRDGKLIYILEGHHDSVMSLAFSQDGKTMASASEDKSFRLWDVATGSLIRTLLEHRLSVTAAAFSPDCSIIAGACRDNSIKLWDDAGSLIHSLRGHLFGMITVAFSPDCRILASGGEDASVKLWDVKTGYSIRTMHGHQRQVTTVAFSPDGRMLATASKDDSVRIWDVKTGNLIRTLQGHQQQATVIAFSPDNLSLASGGEDESVRIWDVKTGNLIRALHGHQRQATAIAFSPDGLCLASGSKDRSVRIWDVETGSLIRSFYGNQQQIATIAFSPDNHILAGGSEDANVRIWDVETGSLIHSIRAYRSGLKTEANSFDNPSPAGAEDAPAGIGDVKAGSLIHSLNCNSRRVTAVALSPDNHILAGGGEDASVRLWDVKTGSLIRTLQGHQNKVWSAAFSPDGRLIASGSLDQSVRIWDVDSGSLIRSLHGHMGPVYAVKFSPNGKYLVAAGAAGRLQFWDFDKGDAFLYLYCFGLGAWLALLPDGRFDGSPEGMRYLCYTEIGTLYSYSAEELMKEFYNPEAIREVLERYTCACR